MSTSPRPLTGVVSDVGLPLPDGTGRTPPARGEGGGPRPPAKRIANARIAVVMLLVGETMLFTALIGAYLVFRFGSVVWPPTNSNR